ncbi:MAG: hypothetical protein HUJ52_02590, partial [Malacoplasma sp.]|nr:hypothetical protein [Malacoplasma sp.]
MSKFISRTKFVIFILIVIQLIAIAAFCGFYFTNFNSFKDYIKDWYLILGACGLVFIDCLFIWIVFIRLAAIRQKTDLSAAEIIGGDIQEAYNFAMLGLVVTDENDIVMWTNDLFKDRQIDIIDRNIFEWKKELNELRNNASDQSITILVNQRNYSVKYLPEAGLWIFKDVDEHFKLYQQYNYQAPVLGLLTIDNYDELFRGEEDYNDTLTKVKSIIYSYAKDYGVLLRRFKDENYSMYCNYDSLVKMREDNFSLIDKVRQESSKEDMPLTLSIGIAHNLHDIIRLNELAKSAQDIAMARGGDQVVITKFGGEMEFIGGKTEAQEKRNRVKIRTLGDTLIGLIRNNKTSNVLVMGHVGMDMDALGACLGIKAICDFYNKKCQVVVDFKKIENKCRAAINSLFSKDELDELC